MMMLWLSCLLIGSITCRTLNKVYGSGGHAAAPALPDRAPLFPWGPHRVGSSNPGSSSSQPMPSFSEASQPSAHVHSNPAFGGYEAYAVSPSSGHGGSGFGGSYGGGYGSSSSGHGGFGGSYDAFGSSASGFGGSYGGSAGGYGDSGFGGGYGGGYVAPHDESSSSGSAIGTGASIEEPEPVFSDVSDLEPVYSYSSRSSYQRGQEVFAQTRYTPEYPVAPFPFSTGKGTSRPSAPAKAPAKGGF